MKIFVTGTDTSVGKTYIATLLLRHFNQQGYSTLGIKPLASGCNNIDGKLYSEDALILQKESSIQLPYDVINPLAFAPAIAPHIAAAQQKTTLSVNELMTCCEYALHYPVDIHIIEGAGGWYLPLNDHETMADFVKAAGLSCILVVGIRLGCLNHALLTYHAIQQSKVPLLGWVANCLEPNMPAQEENINYLRDQLRGSLSF